MSIDAAREVKSMISKMTGVEEESITEDSILFDIAGVDSLKLIEFATHMEVVYKAAPTEKQMRGLITVKDLIELLQKLTAKKKS